MKTTYVTKPTVTGMITSRLRKFKEDLNLNTNGSIPVIDYTELDSLEDGCSALVSLHKGQITPHTTAELREYRRVDGKLYFKVWKGA